ncbi:MAG TPA: ABC transporter substrate-binding protein [Stellaceae bacterium]|nr:ABC transporter substrate-binding protein [Stellaceae bacterium]
MIWFGASSFWALPTELLPTHLRARAQGVGNGLTRTMVGLTTWIVPTGIAAIARDGTQLACPTAKHRLESGMQLYVLGLALVVAVVSAFSPAAEAQAPLPLVDSGKLTWGSAATFPPFESMADDKAVGFDVDMVDALTEKMKLQSTMTGMEFKGLIPAILGNRIDAIVSGMYINPERSQVIDFVPYLKVGNQILVAKGNPLHIEKKMDLCGHSIAAPVGTVYEKAAQGIMADCKNQGKADLTLLSLASTAAGALALKEKRCDAIIASTPTNAALIKDSPDAFQVTGEIFDNNTQLGIGVAKDKPKLREAIDTAFKAIVADDVITNLVKKYGLPPDSTL